MKTKQMVVVIVMLLGMSCAQDALAFYNSSTGRWLSRDPVATEPVRSQVLNRLEDGASGVEELTLYTFTHNQTITSFDWLGLLSTFENCSCCQIDALRNHAVTGQQQIRTLMAQVGSAISQVHADPSKYPWHTEYKLRSAITALTYSALKLITAKVRCDPSNGGAIARSWPWGNTVTVYDSFWEYTETVQGATLVHEGTHMGSATTDAAYFWQHHQYPHDTFWVPWHSIASTYDSWIIEGFCIPGYNCSGSPSFPSPFRSQKECP